MEKTRTPLTIWFEAACHLTTDKDGFSAKTLENTLDVSYRTSWAMLQRYRVSMVRCERVCLACGVELAETYIGSSKEGNADVEVEYLLL